ncbi:CC-NBS-LRR resistance protein, partial [Trifolium medium]|nr:CC-NBS-LRR resistance protein [Trifolium medium]
RGQVGLSIKELRKFPHLQGKLTILNLHNVIDSMEAFAANLKSKEHIEELVLQWGEQTVDHQTDKNVLDVLQPSINMKKLTIGYYGGKSFPSWLGDSSFSNMVYLTISNCEYCLTLPPLGQLSSLKDLRIDGMRILKSIGPEFYGMVGEGSSSSCQPFPSLQNLQFKNMSSWKKWLPFEGSNFPFPCLQTLRDVHGKACIVNTQI